MQTTNLTQRRYEVDNRVAVESNRTGKYSVHRDDYALAARLPDRFFDAGCNLILL